MVTVGLVILQLTNLILLYYLYQELQARETYLTLEIAEIENYLVNHDIEIKEQIKKIPKEITIKNYLKIP